MNVKPPHHSTLPKKHELLPFRVADIALDSSTDFDLYADLGTGMVLYAKAPYLWTKEELSRLTGVGRDVFYYVTRDRDRVEVYGMVHRIQVPDPKIPPYQRLLKVTDAAAELTRILYRYQITPTILEAARTLATSMVNCIEEDPTCIAALGRLAHHDSYTYFHSARVSAHTVAIALELGQSHRAALVEMATGGLLHDIGKTQIGLEILNKPGALTPEEWDLMKKHPVMGDSLLSESSLTMVPRQIILGHHERFDGSGYPQKLTEREMLEEVKIAAFADTFDALTTNRPYQPSRTPYEALDLIRHKLLKNLHKDSYQAMVTLLAKAAVKGSGEPSDKGPPPSP